MGGRVVVVGAVNVDLVVAAERLPGPGETVVGPRVEHFGGGKGANAAVAAARAGADVLLIGAVGADDTGRAALDELRGEGVRVDGVAVLDGVPTGVALIVVDAAGENQIAVGAGANAGVERDQVRAALVDALPHTDCVLVSTEIPLAAVVVAVETATAVGVPCVLNPAPVLPGLAGLLVPRPGLHGPLLTPNVGELAALTGPGPTGVRAVGLAARTEAPVVVTLGGEGALVVEPGGMVEHLPPRPTTVCDTTGAGDTFNGVFAAQLAAGAGLLDAARAANVAAALSVAQVGARGGMPSAELIAASM
ncbi:PfkB family carbohydrate kinase [Pseudonocardia charpentierae]|uniref:Ribokinase n=1 Tax=Pseudonocardia charpentierae TaxID=3075545 RepID=A0ABU2ND23_9PSEU|nr:PfkB family carbohydrate kinase [Pseudonocardia sp. DSM 45834]MDT0351179.1 PfkB family carbohydrate kinase [Pseudonocardia sp. DSM 45834]